MKNRFNGLLIKQRRPDAMMSKTVKTVPWLIGPLTPKLKLGENETFTLF
jgi:hypothetical protein